MNLFRESQILKRFSLKVRVSDCSAVRSEERGDERQEVEIVVVGFWFFPPFFSLYLYFCMLLLLTENRREMRKQREGSAVDRFRK